MELSSQVFGNTRQLRVWLPAGYDPEEPVLYPVLYLNDGQNLFDTQSSQSGLEWEVDETATRLVESGVIPPVVIVGIDNPGLSERPNEYLPWADDSLSPPMPEPHGADYPRFLLEEVIPAVEREFRVGGSSERRLLGGSSYGALISLYTAAANPGEFGGLLLESPSLYVNDAAVLDLAERVANWPDRVFVAIGTHEGRSECLADNRVDEAVDDVRRLERILAAAGSAPKVEVVVEECGMHSERYWARRLPAALRFLLAD